MATEGVVFRNHLIQCTPYGPAGPRSTLECTCNLQKQRVLDNGIPLDGRHTSIALEIRKLGYNSVLVRYTDTSADPRLYSPQDPVLRSFEGILPWFNRVLADIKARP